MKKVIKWGAIIVVGLAILSTLVGDENPNNDVEVQVNEEPLDISWEIYKIEDSSSALSKRFTYRVVIHEPVTPKEIKKVGGKVIKRAKEETPFSALLLFFYDYPEYADSMYVLARATMAPNGEWMEADSVETGDYGSMEVVWDIKEKNWDDRLTPEEAEVFGYWNELLWENPDLSEDEITNIVAREFDLTFKEVDRILKEQLNWVSQDLKE